MPAIAVAHNIPYVATASPAYPFDLMEKVKKAAATKGPAYLQIFSPCPTGWRSAGEISVKLARLAVETGAFPLYEVENGKYNLTMDFEKLRPITDYMKPQGRYRHLTESDIVLIEKKLHEQVQELRDKSSR